MSEPRDAGQLQVAAVARMHLTIDGHALCGRVIIDERDVYSDDAGLRMWNHGPIGRCGQCAAALATKTRRRSPTRPGEERGTDRPATHSRLLGRNGREAEPPACAGHEPREAPDP